VRKTHRYIVAIAAVFAAVTTGVYGEVIDQILATIDTEPVLQSEVMAEVAPEINRLRATAGDQEAFQRQVSELVDKALQQAVDNRILVREAQLAGMEITEQMVEERLDTLRKMYDTNEEFLRDVEASGETMSDLRERLKKQLLAIRMSMAKQREFAKEAVVSESDVAQYYQDHIDEFQRPERVYCRQIFIAADDSETGRAVARERIEMIQREAVSGADFGELAEQYSKAPGAEEGGVIGWVMRGDLWSELEDAAFSTPIGQVSSPVETKAGFHLLLVEKHEEAGLAALDEVRSEIELKLREQAAAERFAKWMEELRKRSRVRVFI
jgi:parvulin-like peptidyl-prolyl isomerase